VLFQLVSGVRSLFDLSMWLVGVGRNVQFGSTCCNVVCAASS
jgi:hypothetical protein